MSGRSDRCFNTPIGAMTFLLRGQACLDRCFDTPVGATTLLLRGHAPLDWCFDTPVGATTLLYMGRHVSVQYCTIPSGSWCTVSISFMVPGLGKRL